MTLATTESTGAARSAFDQQFVSFFVGDQLLGVPVGAVQEVLTPQEIARTPLARREVAGLLNLRGQIVTAVDLRRRLELPPLDADRRSMNIVVHFRDEWFSLLVDEVGDVIDVGGEKLQPVPTTLAARWKAITEGVFRLEDRLFVIVDVAAVLTLDGAPSATRTEHGDGP